MVDAKLTGGLEMKRASSVASSSVRRGLQTLVFWRSGEVWPLAGSRPLAALALVGPSVWLVILFVDNYLKRGHRPGAADAALIIEIGLRQSGWIVAGCALLLFVERLLSRYPGSGWVLALLALTVPCIDQARFLTAGDGISAHAHIGLIRAGLSVALVAFTGGILAWLLLGLGGRLRSWRGRCGWLAAGVSGIAGLAWGVQRGLDFYAYFAAFLVFALATLAVALPLGRRWERRGLSLAGLLVLASLTFVVVSRAVGFGQAEVGDATLASLARVAVGPHSTRAVAELDFDSPASFRCRAPGVASARSLPMVKGQRRNVILISVDALRRDMLRESEGKPVMPQLSAFAARSVEFSEAFSSYPATIYALGSAFTGYSPSELLLAPTLPPSLLRQARGKFGKVDAILPGTGWFKMPAIDRLLLQGLKPKRAASAVEQTAIAIERLEEARERDQTAFLWVHYFEPHEPYQRHPELDFGEGKRAAYLSEVAFVDHELGRLLEYLGRAKWLDDSLVLIFADHGESLGENNRFGHHVSLDASIIDIPLVMSYPGVVARSVTGVVGIADITPTVLEFAGLPAQDDLAARSLFAALDQPEPRGVVAESFPIRGTQLFDLANQPIQSVEQLGARVQGTYQQAKLSYNPKVSLVQGQHRLIVDRVTGDEQLFLRQGPSRDQRVTTGGAAQLEQMRSALVDWHEREAELIYCRVVAHQR
jgi:hypothetical protein